MDRIDDAYNGLMGEEFMRKTRERLHWMCSKVDGVNILDIGCSQGTLARILGSLGKNILGVDINKEAIAFAEGKLAEMDASTRERVRFSSANFMDFKTEECFETVIIGEVLEHLAFPEAFVKKAHGHLVKNGVIVVTVPFGINDDPDHRQTFYWSWINEIIAPYFEIKEVEFFGKWIGVVGLKRERKAGVEKTVSFDVVKELEKAFYAIERPIVNDNKIRSEKMKAQQKTLDDTKTSLSAAKCEAIKAVESETVQRTRADKAAADYAKLKTELTAKIEKQKEELAKASGEKTFAVESVAKQKTILEGEVARQKTALVAEQAKTKDLNSKVVALRNELTTLKNEAVELRANLDASDKVSAGQAEQITVLKAALQFATNRPQIETNEARLLEYSQEVRTLRSSLDMKRDEAVERAERLGHLMGQVEALKVEKELLTGQVAELTEKLSFSKQDIKEKDVELETARREVEKIGAHAASVQDELNEAKSRIQGLENSLERAKENAAHTQHINDEAEQRILKFAEAAKSLERQLEVAHQAMETAKADLVAATKREEEARTTSAKTDAQLKQVNAKVVMLEAELAKAKAALSSEQKKSADQAAALKKANDACVEERKKTSTLTAQVKERDAKNLELRKEKQTLHADNRKLEKRLKRAEFDYNKLSKAKLGRLTLAWWKIKDGIKANLIRHRPESKTNARGTLTQIGNQSVVNSQESDGDGMKTVSRREFIATAHPASQLKVLFFGHDFKFLTPVINFVSSLDGVVVQVYKQKGHQVLPNEEQDAIKLNEWADIVFCEWALGNAVWFSQHKRAGQLLIVRMHAQEFQADLPFLAQMDFDSIDAFVVICQEAVDYMAKHYPRAKVKLIYNPIDIISRFSCAKKSASDHHLGFLGMVPFRKRPDLALEIFEKCAAADRCFKLHIKGKRPADFPWMASRKDEMAQYEDRFDRPFAQSQHKTSVYFDGFDPNPGAWYAKSGFILSTSDFEGSHQAVAEGMAQGCIPIIRDWKSADRLYPKEFVWHTTDEAVAKIKHYLISEEEYYAASQRCREFALKNFDARSICLDYDRLFARHKAWRSVCLANPITSTRVAILAWLPPNVNNGYRVRVEKFAAQFAKMDIRTVLIGLYKGPVPESDLASHKADLENLGCAVHLIPVNGFFDMAMDEASKQDVIRRVLAVVDTEHIDVLQAEAIYCGRIALFIKPYRSRLIVSCDHHGVSPEESEMEGAVPARIKMLEDIEKDLLNKLDFAIFVSRAMEAHYMAKYGAIRPASFAPSSLRKEALRCNITNRNILALPQNRPILGYVGSLAVWQCAEEMFTLFGKLHRYDASIFFAVLTSAADHDNVRKLMAANEIPPEDYLVTAVPFKNVSAATSQFNAGVMLRKLSPVNKVASPTKFGEMIAAGVPIVTTDGIGDFSEQVKNSNFGYIVPLQELDRNDFSNQTLESIQKLLNERRNEDAEFIQRTTDFCRQNLIWEDNVRDLANWYWRLKNIHVSEDGSVYVNKMRMRVANMPESNGCRYYERIKKKIGIICDEFYWDSVASAADFVYLSSSDWEKKITGIDVLYIVSAWHGLRNDDWLNLSYEGTERRNMVYKMIAQCKEKGIPTVFYSKEDPPNYNRFIGLAKHCDYVFTSCEEVIPKYIADCGHNRVYSMSFGINPSIHNPIGSRLGKKEKRIIFSGSWMGNFTKRCEEIRRVFDGVVAAGRELDIIDRNYNNELPMYRYPESFLQFRRPSMDHALLQKVHRLYDWAINANSVQDSRTMFANRVYELQAMGNLLISNDSIGVREKFPGIFIGTTAEAVRDLLVGMTDDEIRSRQAAGVRRVMTGETCFDRIAYMLNTIGINISLRERKILVIANQVTDKIRNMFEAQTYSPKILLAIKDVTEKEYYAADMVAFFDASIDYCKFYLEDMSNAFKYTACDYITKTKASGSGHTYTSRVEDKFNTLFWREAFDYQTLLSSLKEFDCPNGYNAE